MPERNTALVERARTRRVGPAIVRMPRAAVALAIVA
jgi:hypothetical protein